LSGAVTVTVQYICGAAGVNWLRKALLVYEYMHVDECAFTSYYSGRDAIWFVSSRKVEPEVTSAIKLVTL